MTLWCWTCHTSVTNELPDQTVFRGIAYCPECIEAGKDQDPSKYDHDIVLTHTRELEAALATIPRLTAELDEARAHARDRLREASEYCVAVERERDAAQALLREVRVAVLGVIPHDEVISVELLAKIDALLGDPR